MDGTGGDAGMEAHPLWALQVELERGMLRAGADKVRDRVVEAQRRGQMTRLDVVRGLLDDWLPGVAEGIKDWCKTMTKSRGVKPIALAYIQECDPYVAGLIALRTILDGITIERNNVTAMAVHIGRTMEHEQQVRMWEQREPELFHSLQRYLDRTDATNHHRGRVNINKFNALLAEGKFEGGWEKWSEEVHFRVGVVLIDTVVRVTQWFDMIADPFHVYKQHRLKKPKLVLVAKPGLTEWLGKEIEHQEVTSPEYKPTVIPPRRWEGTRRGGYWTPYVRSPRLIRFKANQEDQRDRAADEYEALDMPKVYEAIHFLQEVPWRVNKRVLEIAVTSWALDLGIGKMPLTGESRVPDKEPGTDEDPEKLKKWKRAAASVYGKNAKRMSHVRATSRTMRVAEEYGQYERFYFPHMMDFRGRMYPIPSGLQPQGDDLARGLLEFAEGKTVTLENGAAGWLAVQVASMWGNDKISYDARIAWVEDRNDLWRRIAADPLGNLEWAAKTVDKPWQALAAILDWVGYLEEGFGYVSHAPISVDGTCNGLQHLSAMVRDEAAGAHVNLVPGDKPRDIYKFVAKQLQPTIERIERAGGEQGAYATYWLDLCQRDFPRSLTKKQVMVIPYGGTKDSFFTYARKWLDEHDPAPEDMTKEQFTLRSRRLAFLVGHLWDTCKVEVKRAMKVMEWLQECAKHATQGNQPIFWITPAGFVVRHFYGKVIAKEVAVMLDGSRTNLVMNTTTKDLDIKSQLRGIAPNFVHSQDAAALTLSILYAKEAGITAFSSVHDAYGTHAADMWPLFGHLRQAFVDVHTVDVLSGFRDACQAVLVGLLVAKGMDPLEAAQVADEKLPRLPAKGSLDLAAVLGSDYFFA